MTDLSTTTEALPRDRLTDSNGQLTRGWRNWFEGRGRQIGEVLSGINRNRQSIVDLSASVDSDLSTLEAAIESEATVRASGDSANAALITTLTATVSGRGALNRNAFFDEGPASTGVVPAGWGNWINGDTVAVVTTKPFGGAGLHARMSPLSGTPVNVGWVSNPGVGSARAGAKYLLRADIARESGSLISSGVYVEWYGPSGITGTAVIKFGADADTAGVIAATGDGRRVFEKQMTAPADTYAVVTYAMAAWNGFGEASQATTPQIAWFECSVNLVDRATAQVTNIAEAYATDSGSTARLVWTVNTGTNEAIFEQTAAEGYADGTWNGSAISLTASEIRLNGNVVIAGTLTTTEIASNAVTNSQVSQTASSTSLTNNTWTTVASFSFTSVGIGVELRATCGIRATKSFSGGSLGDLEYRLLRDSTEIVPGRVAPAITFDDGSVAYKQADIVADYNDIPSSGTYTYALQCRINVTDGGVPESTSRTVINRYLSAREFKR